MNRIEQVELAKTQRQAHEVLKNHYAELTMHPVLTDILRELSERQDAAYQTATGELDNAHKSASSLQVANAYASIKAYITDMMLQS